MGTRCTAGGDDAGDMPKNRLNRSLNGSDEPKDEPNAIDMAAPESAERGHTHSNPAPTAPQSERDRRCVQRPPGPHRPFATWTAPDAPRHLDRPHAPRHPDRPARPPTRPPPRAPEMPGSRRGPSTMAP
ncbi:hypothetical protein GCM10010222_49870 [Streptomyces tanashiensis]|nr:hypothetical protein GCM10010222_49870 [Streptomyces tanashiensis]